MIPAQPEILLVAVNARYSHCAYALRSIQANLGSLANRATIIETDLEITPLQLASQIVERNPRIVAFSVYLWNVRLVEAVARILRAIAPHLRVVVGGPELTPEHPATFTTLVDAMIIGEGETAFRTLCERWLSHDDGTHPPLVGCQLSAEILTPPPENCATLALPYHLYTDSDLAQRTVYVESSRGCPYSCTYCTSAETGLRLIPLEHLLPALDTLWQKGLRRFKFLDRSFNAPAAHASAVLDFFFNRATPDMRLHFEINPDQMHESVATRIAAFPRGTLHLEAGIQTLNPRVAAALGRSENTKATLSNLRFLTQRTGAIVHADLIFGLPGENEASFASGFNVLIETCHPPEVQVNLLKALPGTRLAREATTLGLVFNSEPPYEVLRSDVMDFAMIMRVQRFARCWELVHNRNRFPNTVRALHAACAGDYYAAYQTLATRIHAEEGKLFAIGLTRMARHLRAHVIETCGLSLSEADRLLATDLNGTQHREGSSE